MSLIISVGLFAVFVLDVVLGAVTGSSVLGDVQEMLVLFAAAVAFSVAILKRERERK